MWESHKERKLRLIGRKLTLVKVLTTVLLLQLLILMKLRRRTLKDTTKRRRSFTIRKLDSF